MIHFPHDVQLCLINEANAPNDDFKSYSAIGKRWAVSTPAAPRACRASNAT
jgi:hypothetical protein